MDDPSTFVHEPWKTGMEQPEEALSLTSVLSEEEQGPITGAAYRWTMFRRRRSWCQQATSGSIRASSSASKNNTVSASHGGGIGILRGRPKTISFRCSSRGDRPHSVSPSPPPDLIGSSSSSMDDGCGRTATSSPPTSPRLHPMVVSPHLPVQQYEPHINSHIQQRFLQRWMRTVLFVVAQTTRQCISLALNSLLDLLFIILSTIFTIIETAAVWIQQNQILRWIGIALIRMSATMIHLTRRKHRKLSTTNASTGMVSQGQRHHQSLPLPRRPRRWTVDGDVSSASSSLNPLRLRKQSSETRHGILFRRKVTPSL